MAVEVIVVDTVTCLTVFEKRVGQQTETYNQVGKKHKCNDYSFSVVTQHAGN